MSLYIEAAQILSRPKDGSLKSRVYSNSVLKSPPNRLYALIIETLKHQEILNEVIEKAALLQHEKKLTYPLALLLLHDYLLTKSGIATSTGPLKSSILKHKARLSAEFTRARLKRGYATTAALLAASKATLSALPRWVRVNTLKISVDKVLSTAFKEYTVTDDLSSLTECRIYVDPTIPSLLAFSPSSDLTSHPLYTSGALILQDKASCFPAYLLDPPPNASVVDATAAPGNKTTHLAAVMKEGCITAFEKDRRRAQVLQKMVSKAGGDRLITIKAGEDFLKTRPYEDEELRKVSHLLLDPSCSGSGIVTREEYELMTPSVSTAPTASKERKRKRKPALVEPMSTTGEDEEEKKGAVDKSRLLSLSSFQQTMIQHAMTYPLARKITYSTCSIYAEENESVVSAVLTSDIAKQRGWKVLKREDGKLKDWPRRGLKEHCPNDEVADACIRCNPQEDGGIGFFVVGFVRDGRVDEYAPIDNALVEEQEEWKGFSDGNEGRDVEAIPSKASAEHGSLNRPRAKKAKKKKVKTR